MKNISIFLIVALMGLQINCQKKVAVVEEPPIVTANPNDLQSAWDVNTPLTNPDKGWYHHYYDNGTYRYKIKTDEDVSQVIGLHHFFIRIPWVYLEPKEGQFDWSLIDDLVTKWYPKGIKFSICVTAKETDLQYATPKWVRDAGAKGIDVAPSQSWIINTWEPDYGDAVFLQKLENFHKAFATRYDGKEWLVDVVTGSIGSWGEGHTSFSSEKIYPTDVFKKHFDLYSRIYTKSRLVTGDDWVKWNRKPDEIADLQAYVSQRGFSYRDDSILVDWWLKSLPSNQASVAAPYLFESVYKQKPVTLECQHYHLIKEDGNWTVPNGSPKGAAELEKAIGITHATFVGFHGDMATWARENPEPMQKLLNRMGYWFFPKTIEVGDGFKANAANKFSIKWVNKGAAPAYNRYKLYAKLVSTSNSNTVYEQNLSESDNTQWSSSDSETTENYTLNLPATFAKGKYTLQVALKKEEANKPVRIVELGLNSNKKALDGFYVLREVEVN
jgi:Domain of unknown function (DUF4832)/Beta-galactosidase